MAATKTVTAKFLEASYVGGKQARLKGRVKEGPSALLGREVNLYLTLEDIENLYVLSREWKKWHEESEARIAKITAENAGE